jgi:hypothetical protein
MPFGKYGAKSVQALGSLFNSPMANSAYRRAGMIGRKNPQWDDIADITRKGRMRIGGAALGGGIVATHRSSGSRGLQTRSSAPPPGMPPSLM